MLGAKEIIVIEKDSRMIDQLQENLTKNGVQNYQLFEKSFQSMGSVKAIARLVVSTNLPYFGTRTGRGEMSDDLKSLFRIMQKPVLAFISGSETNKDQQEKIEQETEQIFAENGAADVNKIQIKKDFGSPATGFVNFQYYPTYIVNFDEAIVSSDKSDRGGTSLPSKNKGGIDLNPAMYDMKIRRDENGIPLPMPQQPVEIRNIQIDGLFPVIINITPVTSLPIFLGEYEQEEDANVKFFFNETESGLKVSHFC